MKAEERLRKRIRRTLMDAGFELNPNSHDANEFENQILDLFREFVNAPEGAQREVYAKGEKRILGRLRAARVGSRRRSSR